MKTTFQLARRTLRALSVAVIAIGTAAGVSTQLNITSAYAAETVDSGSGFTTLVCDPLYQRLDLTAYIGAEHRGYNQYTQGWAPQDVWVYIEYYYRSNASATWPNRPTTLLSSGV